MKIGHNKPAEPPKAAKPAPAAEAAAQAQTPSAIPGAADASAKIALSSGAASLISGGGTSEFDAEKVARIAKAIEDGTFKIDAGVIADKLIANAQELLGKK